MKVIRTSIPDVLILEPKIFKDERGCFFESFNKREFEKAVGYAVNFVQDNHSKSKKGVLRGLHYQKPPHAQDKLVRCTAGEIFDVAVDIRKESPTFGKWVGINLSADNHCQLWIPKGFAHGFLVLSEVAEVLYKTTDFYNVGSEMAIHWQDESLRIAWPLDNIEPCVSYKDANAEAFFSTNNI